MHRCPTVDIVSVKPSLEAERYALSFKETRSGAFFAQCLDRLGQRHIRSRIYDFLPHNKADIKEQILVLLKKMSASSASRFWILGKETFSAIIYATGSRHIPEAFMKTIGKVWPVTLPCGKACEVVPLPHPGAIPSCSELSAKECPCGCHLMRTVCREMLGAWVGFILGIS